MLQRDKSHEIQEKCLSIIQANDFTGLKKYAPILERQESWVGFGGLSPLHLAAWYNRVEMCQFLLEEGITPDVTEPFTQKTPFHIAAYFGYLEVAKLLKQFGGNLEAKDSVLCSPIHYAAMSKHKEGILFFLENRSLPSVQSIFGNVLDILIRKKSLELVDLFSSVNGIGSLDYEYFWREVPDRSLEDQKWTPFHSAVISGHEGILEMLMRKFPFVSAIKERKLGYGRLEFSTTPFDLALLEGSTNIKQMLRVEGDTKEYRKQFMKTNWYEADFPQRKELCNAIRYREIEKARGIINDQGLDVIFQREEQKSLDRLFGSSTKPNALDFATYVYSLPFFEFLIEGKIEIPFKEFVIPERHSALFFNWALMEVHPLGEGFFKKMGKEGVHEQNLT